MPTVRPVFNISKEDWKLFKQVFPDFDSWLSKFVEESSVYPLSILRVRSILNLFTSEDRKLDVYLNPGPRQELTNEEISYFSDKLRKDMERIDSIRWDKEVQQNRPLDLPPITQDSAQASILWAFNSFSVREGILVTNSHYDLLKTLFWMSKYNLKYVFKYLDSKDNYAYSVKIL